MKGSDTLNLNPVKLLKLKTDMENFAANHPKFAEFLKKVINGGAKPDDVLEIKLIGSNGNIETKIKLKDSDLELLKTLKELM